MIHFRIKRVLTALPEKTCQQFGVCKHSILCSRMSVEAGWIPVSSCSRIRGFRQRWKLVSGDRQKTRCASLNRCNACKKRCQLQSNCDSKKLTAHWQPLLSWPWRFWLDELSQCLVCILIIINILEVTFRFFGLARAFLFLYSKDEAAATYFVDLGMRADIRGNSQLGFIQQNPHAYHLKRLFVY